MPSFDLIHNSIFIGNVHSVIGNYATQDSDVLDILQIKTVISALSEEEYAHYELSKEDLQDIEWYRLVIDDDEEERISNYFFDVHKIIRDSVANGKNVMVHCAAGISRSVTLVIAYLMIENGWAMREAYNYVKSRREIIEPNIGFMKQLQGLEYKLKQYRKI